MVKEAKFPFFSRGFGEIDDLIELGVKEQPENGHGYHAVTTNT